MTYLETTESMKQERRYRRWLWERRLRRAAPWLISVAMVAALFWLARR